MQILTVTLNPALDIGTSVPVVEPGPKLRCSAPRVDPGGGGLNVARAVGLLGGRATAFVALGGPTGDRLLKLLADHGVPTLAFPAPGDTRESLTVTETGTGRQYRFVLPGTAWDAARAARVEQAIPAVAPPGGWVVLSGSQAPGLPEDFAARLRRALPAGTRLLADTSGAPLRRLVAEPAGLDVLRMDDAEAEDLARRPLPDRAASADFAADLVARGVAQCVILARGAEGSVLAARDGTRLFAPAAPVPVVSKVGAGDSFVAGYVLTRARGGDQAAALSAGVAAASAAVMTEGTELCRPDDVARLLPLCPATAL